VTRGAGVALITFGMLAALSGCGSREERAAKAMVRFQGYFAQGDLYKARVEIRSAIHQEDDVPEYWNKLGSVELALNNYQNAFSAYRRVIELDPQNREAIQAMAELSFSSAQRDDALKYANQILRIEPRNMRMLLIKGLVAYDREEYSDARALAERIQAIDPSNEGAAILLSRVQYSTDDPKLAIATMENSIRRDGVSMQKLVMLLDYYDKQNDFPRLNHTYARMFRLAPDDVPLRLEYARALYENDLPGPALDVIEHLQHRYPNDPKLQGQIVDVWTAVGSKAIVIDQVRHLADEGSDEMKLALGEFAVDQHRYAEAVHILSPFLGEGKIAPDNVQANVLYAFALSGLGRKDQALALVNRILDFDSSNSRALLLRVQIATDRHDLVNALNDAQILTRDNPTLAPGWIAFARIYTVRKERALADGIYGRAADYLPDNIEILSSYTAYIVDTGRSALARDIADRFTRANPRLLDGWRIRADLCLAAGDNACLALVMNRIATLRGGNRLRTAIEAKMPRKPATAPLPAKGGRLVAWRAVDRPFPPAILQYHAARTPAEGAKAIGAGTGTGDAGAMTMAVRIDARSC
jgi:cytochrome c-type biogenesis protein CcmH/NrfG